MNQKQIKNITDNHYWQLNKLIKKISAHFFARDIHEFRVEYKKLRAFLRMISAEYSIAGEIKVGKKLKTVYHILGAVRDIQVLKKSILKATKQDPVKPKEYLLLLQKEIKELQKEFAEMILTKPVIGSKNKTDGYLPYKFSVSNFTDFAHHKLVAVNTIIVSGNFADNNIHSIRKNLKDLFYNLKILPAIKNEKLSIEILRSKDGKYFNDFLDTLGNFQDKHTAVDFLKPDVLKNLNTYNRELLKRVKKNWLKEKAIIKQLLIKQLKTDFILERAIQINHEKPVTDIKIKRARIKIQPLS
jgi:CHAD domain-containing protein